MDFTPSKKPFVENTLREVYILRDELNTEKMKTKQLSETLRKVIDDTKLPKDQFRWYKLLGGNTMKLTRRYRRKRGGQPALPGSIALTGPASAVNPLRTPHTGRSRRRRSRRGGQPTPSRTPAPGSVPMPPLTGWSPSVTQAALPGSSAMPDSRPRLMRSDAMYDASSSSGVARHIDFSRLGLAQDRPGCVPISKRLPGHRNDQCEQSDSASSYDRSICKQPGDEGVQILSDCGPVRAGVGGRRRKSSKTKKSTRRHIRH